MSCACQPCAPQTPRCKCQRDAWVALPPANYQDALSDCDDLDCDFPEVLGLPGDSYRPDEWPSEDMTICLDDALEALTESLSDCDEELESSAPSPPYGQSALSAHCACRASASATNKTSQALCDTSIAYPATFSFLTERINADKE